MKLLIIRHAEPDYENNTLTKKGFEEAETLGEYYKDLHIDEIYSSPYNRSLYTAEGLNKFHNLNIKIIDEFREFNYPIKVPYSDKPKITWDFLIGKIYNENDLFEKSKYLNHQYLESGNIKDYYNAVISKFNEILKNNGYEFVKNGYFNAFKNNKKTIVIVCHHGLESVLLSELLNVPFTSIGQFMCALPSSVTTLVTEEREKGSAQFRLLEYGSVTHLLNAKEEVSFMGRFCECFEDDTRHE